MDKSILIIDTPACCAGCDLCDTFWNDWEVRCVATGSKLESGKHYKQRMADCPLIPLKNFVQKSTDNFNAKMYDVATHPARDPIFHEDRDLGDDWNPLTGEWD